MKLKTKPQHQHKHNVMKISSTGGMVFRSELLSNAIERIYDIVCCAVIS